MKDTNNSNNKAKVTIIGAGYVGSTISYALILSNIVDEIVLIDRNNDKVESEINDIRHGFPFVGRTILRKGDYTDVLDSHIIILAIGRNRKVGESRLDLANDNTIIAKEYIDKMKKYYNDSVILVVTNPIDIITTNVTNWMNMPYGKIIGTGCILDSSRFVRLIADYTKVDIGEVRAMVVGEHGDSQVALWSKVKVKGISIYDYCKQNNLVWNDDIKVEIENNVRNMGASIIKGKQRTQYGIATCTADIINAIIKDKQIIISVSSILQGELGLYGKALSFPSVIGYNGIIDRQKVDWTEEEKNRFVKSYNALYFIDI